MGKKLLFATVLLLGFCVVARPETQITSNNFIKNSDGGYCVWCCLDMIGREFNIKPLIGIKAKKQQLGMGPILCTNIPSVLDELKVKYRYQQHNIKNKQILKYAEDHDLPAMIIIKHKNATMSHAVVITKFKLPNDIIVVDPNCEENYWKVSEEWIDYYWTGSTFIIEK